MPTGTVKWFSDEKGFGFVTPDELGKDLFVHHTGIAGDGVKSLAEGAKVEYDAEPSVKESQSVNVRPLQLREAGHEWRQLRSSSPPARLSRSPGPSRTPQSSSRMRPAAVRER